ncbi:MAG TPA: M1 family metallopeptidase [Bryobacteraceae bacterium]|nr:M1 family metallopeptidase [Bryobacteraceae bacterium]
MKNLPQVCGAAALVIFCTCARASVTPPALRLDEPARPVRYAAELTIVPNQDTFQGAIDIQIDFTQPQSLLWLNAHQLKVSNAVLRSGADQIAAKIVPGTDEVMGFDFGQPISGEGTLHVEYTGVIHRRNSDGVFQLEQDGRWYVYSQFEAISARWAFPCFDEPSYKTPWQLTLRVPNEQEAFNNYPAVSEAPAPNGMKVVKFAETRPLPSYLVAFAVGPFDIVDAGKVGNTPVRIIVPHGRSGDTKYAVETIPRQLAALERYFGIPYPYPKLDSVSMRVGGFAMENAGLITYDESLLLSNPATDTLARQREAAEVTAHEMAHQWFGDLVTTAWWNDIWLNEAFATWMERRILAELEPTWKMDVAEASERAKAMALDSLVSARRIRQPIDSYDDIANAFDNITYEKGAAVIAMFERWVGPDKFRAGVHLYMKRHADGNATAADFTRAVSEAAGKDITPAFDSFLDQAGVPVVSVALDRDSVDLRQNRSLPLGSPAAPPQTWDIPVCMRYGSAAASRSECSLLSQPAARITPVTYSRPDWIVGNAGDNGYYRVNYTPDLLAKITADNGRLLTEPERVGLLWDVDAEMHSGTISPKTALALVPRFAEDPARQVVEADLHLAGILESPIVPASLQPKAEQFIRDNFGRRAEELGWQPKPGESEDERLLRETLVPAVASQGRDPVLIARARELALEWLRDHNAVNPGMAGSVLRIAAEFGDRHFFDQLHAAAKKEKDQRFREEIIDAMGSFRNPEIARAALPILLTNEFDPRESEHLFRGPLEYPETRALPWEFVRRNYDALVKQMPTAAGLDDAAEFPQVGTAFCDATHRDEIREFFAPRMAGHAGGPRILAQTLERMNSCIAQKEALGPELSAFLESYGR